MNSPLILSVSQLNAYSRSLIDADSNLNNVFVTGEISNFKRHYSGHMYMSLKDDTSSVKAVMFAGNASRLRFNPENGMSVIIRGRASIYERDGQFQLYIDDMQPDGVGALALAFEQTKEKLARAGIFEESHKKSIPAFPDKIGVITSPTGAAAQDILNVLNRRFPAAEVIFAGVQVQGDGACVQLCKALELFNALNCADVIIIARGGGSAEDLWQFNDERLAYAIYNSKIPVISGVGHETDYTICDFAADLRAPTPSAAAELATPDREEQYIYVSGLKSTVHSLVEEKIDTEERRLDSLKSSTALKNPFFTVDNCDIFLDSLWNKANSAFVKTISEHSSHFSALCSSLEALSPLRVLSRGYSIVKDGDGEILKSARAVKNSSQIKITLADGTVSGVITEVNYE